jgi:hypothetical protein
MTRYKLGPECGSVGYICIFPCMGVSEFCGGFLDNVEYAKIRLSFNLCRLYISPYTVHLSR